MQRRHGSSSESFDPLQNDALEVQRWNIKVDGSGSKGTRGDGRSGDTRLGVAVKLFILPALETTSLKQMFGGNKIGDSSQKQGSRPVT